MEAVYAHYCLQKLGILPGQFLALDRWERAFVMSTFVIASIDVRSEKEKKEEEELKNRKG